MRRLPPSAHSVHSTARSTKRIVGLDRINGLGAQENAPAKSEKPERPILRRGTVYSRSPERRPAPSPRVSARQAQPVRRPLCRNAGEPRLAWRSGTDLCCLDLPSNPAPFGLPLQPLLLDQNRPRLCLMPRLSQNLRTLHPGLRSEVVAQMVLPLPLQPVDAPVVGGGVAQKSTVLTPVEGQFACLRPTFRIVVKPPELRSAIRTIEAP